MARSTVIRPGSLPSREDELRFIAQRIRLRDLHAFLTAAETGSMAKAAARLGISQPAVSVVIADLEHGLRARLFDRTPRGITLTRYGESLRRRALVAFDELRLGMRDIEGLANPAEGEVRVGCPESIAGSLMPPILERFAAHYPRVVVMLEHVSTPTLEVPRLRDRSLDLVVARLVKRPEDDPSSDDLAIEHLFNDRVSVAASTTSRWARRRGAIDLAELADERWILTPPGAWNRTVLEDAFQKRGLPAPRVALVTYSLLARARLLASGRYVTVLSDSVLKLNAKELGMKPLRVELPQPRWPVALVTLKHRMLSPVAERFMDEVRKACQA